MNIITPSIEIIEQAPGMLGALKHIEKVGRTCYKSEDKITENSHINFVNMLIDNKHLAMLEHATIYLTVPLEKEAIVELYEKNPYSMVVIPKKDHYAYITTNSRVIIENDWQCDMAYMVSVPTKHKKRVTIKFSTQIAISREFNRHRVNSVAEQSSRYCNYSKDKFNNSISISLPSWISAKDAEVQPTFGEYCAAVSDLHNAAWDAIDYWLFATMACEYSYMNLIRLGWTPEKARVVLPLDTHTELIHTAFIDDWKHFLDLRYHEKTGKAHPDAKILAGEVHAQLKKLHYL